MCNIKINQMNRNEANSRNVLVRLLRIDSRASSHQAMTGRSLITELENNNSRSINQVFR